MDVLIKMGVVLFGDSAGIPVLLRAIPEEINVKALVTASNRPQHASFVSGLAEKLQIPHLVQPPLRNMGSSFVESISHLNASHLLCYSYSQIIPQVILDNFNGNCFNIHASLLPKNRGANPIQWAILRDEKITGATIHQMTSVLDAGAVLAQIECEILETDTWLTLMRRVNSCVEKLATEQVPKIFSNTFSLERQNEDEATENFRLTPSFPEINFRTMTNRDIFNLIRAQVAPLCGAYVNSEEEKIHFDKYVLESEVQNLRERFDK